MLHGARSYLLQDEDGQVQEAHSISAGLDYPGVGPEHSWLKEPGRVNYFSATDAEALEAFQLLAGSKASSPRSNPRTPLPISMRVAPKMAKDNIAFLVFRAAATRMCSRSPTRWVKNYEPHCLRALPNLEAQNRAGFIPFITAGDPDAETSFAILEKLAGSGRRYHRTRHAVLRSDGGWPRDPGVLHARAESGHELKKTLALVERFRAQRHDDADRADGLFQSDPCLWRRTLCRAMRRTRASMA